MGIGRSIGHGFMFSRDAVARGLIALGISPNSLTVLGTAFTVGAGVFLALGAGDRFNGHGAWGNLLARWDGVSVGFSSWNLWAALCIFLSSATDMLDGAVARLANAGTVFGAFLDSTLDRISDCAIFTGIAFFYAWRGNATYTLLAIVAMCNAYAISYTRARAESLLPNFKAGYWQRGERIAAVLISILAFNIPAMLWQQAISPAFTVWRRIRCSWDVAQGRKVIEDPREGTWLDKIQLWRWPRMTLAYDVITGANIAFLIFAPIPQVDLIRWLVQH
jgi:CDP-diacylglycerol---glycerol-3-phosphate 3-phosphatidyltransferase